MARHRREVLRAGCGVVGLVFLGGCVSDQPEDTGEGSSSATETDDSSSGKETESTAADGDTGGAQTDSMPNRSSLSNGIAQVADADTPEAVADAHGIEYRNGDVRVLVQLEPDGVLPEAHVSSIITELDGSVIAWVAVDALVALGDDENVRSVRPVPPTDTHG